jgi:MFS family permease
MALSGALGNGLWGTLAERFHPRTLNVMTMMVASLSVAWLMQVDTAPAAYVFAFLFGVNARGAAVLTQVLIARYFGRRPSAPSAAFWIPFTKAVSAWARCSPASVSITPATIARSSSCF